MDLNSTAGEVYIIQGENGEENEELSEVIVDDDRAPLDDESTVWTEADGDNDSDVDDDGDDINDLQEVPDDSVAFFACHKESVYSVCNHKSKRGLVISGGGDDKGYLWKYSSSLNDNENESGKCILSCHELGGHTDTVTSVGFSHDGDLAYTAGYDGVVRLWDVETGTFIIALDGPQDVEWAQWHGKGRAIIAGSSDGTAWMWVEIGGLWQCLQVYAGAHDGAVSCGCFTADGKYVCTGGSDGTIRIWNPKTGKCKQSFTGHQAHTGAVTSMTSSVDGDLLLTGSEDGSMKLLQISGKRVLQTFIHFDPTATATITSSSNMDTSSSSTSLSNPSATVFPPPPPFSSSSRRKDNTDSMSVDNEDDNQDAMVEEIVEEGKILSVECVGMATLPATATVGSEYQWVASGGLDSMLKIWDAVSGTLRHSCRHIGGVVALQWHSILPLIATAALDNLVRLWDARSGMNLKVFSGHTDLVTNIELSLIPPVAAAAAAAATTISPSESSFTGDSTSTTTTTNTNEDNEDTDMISSVSDDGTVRIFHFHAKKLLYS